MPPGTGDVALSLSQTVPVAGAIVVTTPQQVSLADTPARGADVPEAQHPADRPHREHESLRLPELRSTKRHLRPRRRRARWPPSSAIPFLGRIPIYQPMREGGDTGVPLVISEPDSPAARAFMAAAERIAAQVSIASFTAPPTIPLTVVR